MHWLAHFKSSRSKETPTQVFSCGFCETFKNNFFHRTPPVAASAISDQNSISIPPENVKKHLTFQGVWKWNIGLK